MQALGDAIEATKGLDETKLAQYMPSHTFQKIVGGLAFGPDGEWTEARPLWVQYHGINGNDLEQFKNLTTVTILKPEKYKTGELIYPYTEARN